MSVEVNERHDPPIEEQVTWHLPETEVSISWSRAHQGSGSVVTVGGCILLKLIARRRAIPDCAHMSTDPQAIAFRNIQARLGYVAAGFFRLTADNLGDPEMPALYSAIGDQRVWKNPEDESAGKPGKLVCTANDRPLDLPPVSVRDLSTLWGKVYPDKALPPAESLGNGWLRLPPVEL